jgi:hypothetical protein
MKRTDLYGVAALIVVLVVVVIAKLMIYRLLGF